MIWYAMPHFGFWLLWPSGQLSLYNQAALLFVSLSSSVDSAPGHMVYASEFIYHICIGLLPPIGGHQVICIHSIYMAF